MLRILYFIQKKTFFYSFYKDKFVVAKEQDSDDEQIDKV